MDLIDETDGAGDGGGNAPEFTVSEISGAVKRVIEGEFGHVRIRGEVGRVSRPRSGHVYLDLKDDRAVISGVMWKGVAARQTTPPEEGMEVVAIGRLTTFPGQSKYQIVIEEIRPAGLGALMATLEKRRLALAAEGLFDEARKRALPFLPEVIGVVTSPSGAVIRDILHRLRDRFPRRVLIWPVAVQGARCAPEVAAAIAGFNALKPDGAIPRPDLLIVARGGGSVEDLWGFNEEVVVRAAAQSAIPLISAVGHETDTTLIDHAADRRAPTPTAAAELAVPVRLDLLAWTAGQGARLGRALRGQLSQRAQRLSDVSRALPRSESLLDTPRQRLDMLSDRLSAALRNGVQQRRLHLSEAGGSLRGAVLRRRLESEAARLAALARRRDPALLRGLAGRRAALEALRLRPRALDLAGRARLLETLARRLERAESARRAAAAARLGAAARLIDTLSYHQTLARGYAVVRDGTGQVLTGKSEASGAAELEIEFRDGRLRLGGRRARRAPAADPGPAQGSLF
ncbi:MAG: exodeoxyribonuclease VII large subunit [Rhodobacteraceae bacterium]|nr:exodeoxyribonuclease VII large subunit [Paracoccaceae bacterium]